jgi:hypothetical protein
MAVSNSRWPFMHGAGQLLSTFKKLALHKSVRLGLWLKTTNMAALQQAILNHAAHTHSKPELVISEQYTP